MEMFNIKDRRNPSMDSYYNLKNPGFGGPSSKQDFDKSKRTILKDYQRVIDRNADFEGGKFNHNYDTTWKAVTRDLISRSANKKPFDPMYAKQTVSTAEAVEEGKIFRFEEFVNENYNMFAEAEEENPFENGEETESDKDEEIEVDEEKLETLMEDYGDELKDLVEDIAEKLEVEKEEAFDLLCAAIKKMKDMPEESEESEESSSEEETEEEEEEEGA